jgi:hypothetical protein
MTRKGLKGLSVLFFILTVLGIGFLFIVPRDHPQAKKQRQTRLVIPQSAAARESYEAGSAAERMAYEDSVNAKVALEEGETMVTTLTQDIDGDLLDEQIIAYRNLLELDSPIYITYADFDGQTGGYKRIWSAPTAATRPGTVTLYAQDLIGDRSNCVLVSGMNGAGEHTLTVFRKNSLDASPAEASPAGVFPTGDSPGEGQIFNKIAELRIDGSISVQEAERAQAYHLGFTRGQSFTIAAYGRDYASSNILDQVEITYSYNPGNGLYEQSGITRVPGSQIEQRRVRELLNGGSEAFESFINGLWYYVSPEGTMDNRQYIYFDPLNREVIFYGEEIQQVFSWQNSSSTRYGLYISSQNISVSTLRRFLDIELESLESIRLKVFEDVRLKIKVSAPWDGSYRKAGMVELKTAQAAPDNSMAPHIDAVYDGSIGKISFSGNGAYILNSGGTVQQGKYAFFLLDNQELLELRPQNGMGMTRETYRLERSGQEDPEGIDPGGLYKNITLVRIRLGTRGVQELHEAAISLALISKGPESGS